MLVGVTGATFFATAGGVALVTSLFGLTGGGLAGWKMHKRMKGVEEFEFKQILNDPDLPPVPALRCTICVSGFLLDSKEETRVKIKMFIMEMLLTKFYSHLGNMLLKENEIIQIYSVWNMKQKYCYNLVIRLEDL